MSATNRHNDSHLQVENAKAYSQKELDDLKKLGCKIKHHEENLKALATQRRNLDKSILRMCAALQEDSSQGVTESQQILEQKKTAAGILYQFKTLPGTEPSQLPLTKNVIGIVASLGKVSNNNLSRLFSEYVGLDTMLAIVCKSYGVVKALEAYDSNGQIDEASGLHGLGRPIGLSMEGHIVISLEDLRPYEGEFDIDNPQRKLALLKPRLPNGECPEGFIDFAVNMIDLDNVHLSHLTSRGHGLRETLFYYLFSRLQVYRTRSEMQLAIPFITDGAISLDGGMIKAPGVFLLGNRKDLLLRFPVSSEVPRHVSSTEAKEKLESLLSKKEIIAKDMQKEAACLKHAKADFDTKKKEFLEFILDYSATTTDMVQVQVRAEKELITYKRRPKDAISDVEAVLQRIGNPQ